MSSRFQTYGPTQKFLARLNQNPDLNHPTQMTLPRMSFEFTNLVYDPSRKTTQTQQMVIKSSDGTEERKTYLPVPYNMTIVLSVYTKLNDDMLQIVEQIVPYFQPGYTLPIKFLGNFNEVRNVPVVLDNIDMSDEYEGNFDTRRKLFFTHLHLQSRLWSSDLSRMFLGISSRKFLLVMLPVVRMVVNMREILHIKLLQG